MKTHQDIYSQEKLRLTPNYWDIFALIFILSIIALCMWSAHQMSAPYNLGETLSITLSPHYLPFYALRTIFRMLCALMLSLLVTFILGTLAAKNKHAEKVIIPLIDLAQSVPVLAFQAIAVVPFIRLFPGSLLGPECAAIFAIFTAQAWNMILGFYQTVRTVPKELKEAAQMFQLNAWQQFWRVEVPYSMPGLLWNTMMSMSASWFFVVAVEAISVTNQEIRLPGIGSYIALAIEQANLPAIFYAILTMFIVILLYDQILFRPLVMWSEKFKSDLVASEQESFSLILTLLQKTRLLRWVEVAFSYGVDAWINLRWFKKKIAVRKKGKKTRDISKLGVYLWNIFLIAVIIACIWFLLHFVIQVITWQEILQVTIYGAYTSLRVLILIILSSCVWVPIGVWIGRNPTTAQFAQPIVQFLAAFPANLVFPLVFFMIVTFHLNVEIWLSPLMILGAQWYILFNVIAGASAIPKDLYYVANNFSVKGWLWWRKVILPGIFPYYITGAITASGGAWNASIVAEIVNWGHTTLTATGLGAYIAEYTKSGDFHRIALGVGMMCLYVFAFTLFLWRPLYRFAEERFVN